MIASQPLAITGFGMISAAGINDDEALAQLLRAGGTALAQRARIERPPPRWTGTVPERLDLDMGELADGVAQRLCVDWGIRAGHTALARAGVEQPAALGLVLASNLEDHPRTLAELAVEIAAALGVHGPRLVTSMACASSLAALSLARSLLANADVDAVLVIGSDVLTPRVIAAFDRLALLCEQPCAPFSTRVGISLGEGAAAFVLERASSRALGTGQAKVIASVLAEGLAADAHHPTSPEPNGAGTRAAMHAALTQAGLGPRDVQMILAHGTGTIANDAAELCGLARAGLSATDTPIVALKSVFGHAQGAAGAVELAAMLVAWASEITPVTANFESLRAGASWQVSRPGRSRPPVPERVVLSSAGFGGTSAAVIVARGHAASRAVEELPPIYIQRWASAGWDPSDDAINWRRAVRGVDLRGVDPSTRLLTLAVDRALQRSRDADTGLIVAQARSSAAAVARLRDEIQQHGLEHVAGSALAEPLTIMPAGGCTRIIGLRGPFGLCVADQCGQLLALSWAADQLRRSDCSRMIAAVLDERVGEPADGAAALVLARAGEIRLAGWAILGHGRGDEALTRACERAGLARAELEQTVQIGPGISIPIAEGARAVMRACESLEPGASVALVVDEPARAAIAIVLIRETELRPPARSPDQPASAADGRSCAG
ncbi:beta-ketoacyl synthase N-terminal-like domain-containing protein [Enhygromyxa salina]|uniref:3-oxoacyl-[acyl-carrier-protein] synthase 2 n=1 Tax=Enhygromyxa salina TaxID=215803 RepID=A0A2S9YVX2_9BACT|nr:beta-ketoacyl synthase N-terminal-like domain-containing protein [Enhygromyxa salina]PRQ09233.1 3-oxoacyl-[acyl-carrier-protein] synthase 2 [Enhygromyxa salina]